MPETRLDEPDVPAAAQDRDAAARRRRTPTRLRAALACALVVLVVLGLAASGSLLFRSLNPTAQPFSPASGPVLPAERERAQVIAVAEQFTLRMDNVDASDFDAYLAGINEMLTTKARADNEEALEVMKQTYEAAEVQGEGAVLATGVADLSGDAASVLVAHDAGVTTTQGDIEHHYRWAIDLAKVDGDWLVDGFTPVS